MGMGLGFPSGLGQPKYLGYLAGFGVVPAMVQLVAAVICPETPKHLLLSKFNLGAAERSVVFYQGSSVRPQTVLDSIQEEMRVEAKDSGSVKTVFLVPHIRRAALLGCLAMGVQVFSGYLPLVMYSGDFFKDAGMSDGMANVASLLVGLLNVAATAIAIFVIDRFGRRRLLLGAGLGTLVSLLVFTVFFILKHYSIGAGWTGYVGAAIVWVFIGIYSFGPGPIPYFVAAELVEQHSRSLVVGLGTGVFAALSLILGLVFLPLFDKISAFSLIILCIAPSTMALGLLFFKLPEAKSREVADVVREMEILNDINKRLMSRNTSEIVFQITEN